MLRKTIIALGAAAVAAKNCGGALSVDPRYCTGINVNGEPYCRSTELKEDDTVPLRIRLTNNANFENDDFDTIYVPGQLQAHKRIQIVFACEDDECKQAYTPLTYTDSFVTESAFAGAEFKMGPCLDAFGATAPGNPQDPAYDGEDFNGVQLCSDLPPEVQEKGCGCVKLGSSPVAIDGDQTLTLGQIFMKAGPYQEDNFIVHIAADEGILKTVGNICLPEELTASGTGTAQAGYMDFSPPSSPPPSTPPHPPPPPPPPTSPAACVCMGGTTHDGLYCASYGKCHWCDEPLPEGGCYWDGPGQSCKTSCADLVSQKTYTKRWGACSSECPVSASKDPHLHLPHGGRADFRGRDDTVFNLLSAKDVAFNVLFEKGDFAWATRLVHGTKMAAGYWVVNTKTGKTLNIEYTARKSDPVAIVREEEHRDVQVRQGTPALVVDDLIVSMVGKTLTVRTSKWLFTATTSAYPFGKLEVNKNKVLLDVSVQPLYDPDTDVVAPHGILGQSYDQDKIAVDGKIDEEKAGESTTTAQAEGAIEGTWEDYIVPSKFSTEFKYSRFGLTKAAPRDVSKLTGTKKAAEAAIVGASDQK